MLSIDPSVACYKLEVCLKAKLVQQKPRRLALDQRDQVNKEVDCLFSVEFIKSVEFPRWMSNIVIVPKKNGQIRFT